MFEGGDGFDEAGDGEGVTDTALTADEVQATTLTSEGNGKLDESRNTGAIDLRNVVQVDDEFSRAALHEILGELGQMFAGFANGETAMDLEVMDAGSLAGRNFQSWMERHLRFPQFDVDGR